MIGSRAVARLSLPVLALSACLAACDDGERTPATQVIVAITSLSERS